MDGGATLTDFTNHVDGILINRGGIDLREDGFDNFGFIRNGAEGSIWYEWNVTNHLGAFIENAGELRANGPASPSRPFLLNNLSTLVNLCGGEITGDQILVGNPPLVGLELRLDPSGPLHLQWCTAPGILFYDVIQGDLATLLAGGGDFTQATTGCLADQSAGPGSFAPDPGPGVGFWFLVRPDGASYDSNYPSQAASRDAGIAASGMACP